MRDMETPASESLRDSDRYFDQYSTLRNSTLLRSDRSRIGEKVDSLQIQVAEAIQGGKEFLFSVQRQEHFWCAELDSNPSITSEYVLMCQILKLNLDDKKDAIVSHLLDRQLSNGSWSIAQDWVGDVSTTAETYLALRILGLEPTHEALSRAEKFIREQGGLEKIRVFTRIFFAMFGLVPWTATPVIPAEFILFPSQFPINIYALASWARSTMVPLFIIFHHQPIYALPNGRSKNNSWMDHLWIDPKNKGAAFESSLADLLVKNKLSWKSFFGLTEPFLKFYNKKQIKKVRELALKECTSWILERQEKDGGWAGIFPPMINGIIALSLQGYSMESEPIKKGLQAIHDFSWEDPQGYRIQACVSPVWDTVLTTISLVDTNCDPQNERLKKAVQWVLDRQLLVSYGDWKVYRPELVSGGWSFEYTNSWYPDVDDTAAVVLALLKQNPLSAYQQPVIRAIEWMLGMQNRDGGWGAFDVNNDKLFLNDIPFSDMDSLCDPSSADVTGRVLESYGMLLKILRHDLHQNESADGIDRSSRKKDGPLSFPENLREKILRSSDLGVSYLRSTQEPEGSWFGRWGVNYIYGTSNVLCGLMQMAVPESDPMVVRALRWLDRVQNEDGGWGESLESYADRNWMGRGASSASQTAWALMGLLSYRYSQDTPVERGVRWLVQNQTPAQPIQAYEGGKPLPQAKGATWEESHFTGTGFPNHFYLKYNYYRHYFPMMALGRYLKGLSN